MKELLLLGALTFSFFVAFAVAAVKFFQKRSRVRLGWTAGLFGLFLLTGAFTGFVFLKKVYRNVQEATRPQTGLEIYTAVFGKPQSDCLQVLETLEPVVPRIDVGLYLHFKTCPEEIQRILSLHPFETKKGVQHRVSFVDLPDWFQPERLGENWKTYYFQRDLDGDGQWIFSNLEETEGFCADIAD